MATPQALIQGLEGEVSVTRNGEIVNVKAGDYLLPGDVVETGSNGRLSLEFPGVEGQTPAQGTMSANGKITLGEQPGASGQQMVVIEEGECFEFDGDLTEDSAVASKDAGGLFGEFAGNGAAVAGAGASAAGLFAGSSDPDSNGAPSSVETSGTGGGFEPAAFSPEDVSDPQGLAEKVVEQAESAANSESSGPLVADTAAEEAFQPVSDGTGAPNPFTETEADNELLAQLAGNEGAEPGIEAVTDPLSAGPVTDTVSQVDEAIGFSEQAPAELSGGVYEVTGTVDDGLAELAGGIEEAFEPVGGAFNEVEAGLAEVDGNLPEGEGMPEGEGLPVGEGEPELSEEGVQGLIGDANTLISQGNQGGMPDDLGMVEDGLSSIASDAGVDDVVNPSDVPGSGLM
ncbi:MAG: hypothetical protein R3194_01770 [Limnobacter sp.]|nr:hypothetical protein [Limnobacter sp.]